MQEDELKEKQENLPQFSPTFSPSDIIGHIPQITNKKYYSGRNGLISIREAIQKDDLDQITRTKIFNYLNGEINPSFSFPPLAAYSLYEIDSINREKRKVNQLKKHILLNVFSYKEIEVNEDDFQNILDRFISYATYDQIFSFLEALVPLKLNSFELKINQIFETEMVGYRITHGIISSIISDDEIESIENAINSKGQYDICSQRLEKAFRLLSDKSNPDYENSIKESISAIESICQIIVGKPTSGKITTLGDALKIIENTLGMNPALAKGLSSIYGYTSNANGVRHANAFDGQTITFEDAKFMLVSCSAFLNYLISFNDRLESITK